MAHAATGIGVGLPPEYERGNTAGPTLHTRYEHFCYRRDRALHPLHAEERRVEEIPETYPTGCDHALPRPIRAGRRTGSQVDRLANLTTDLCWRSARRCRWGSRSPRRACAAGCLPRRQSSALRATGVGNGALASGGVRCSRRRVDRPGIPTLIDAVTADEVATTSARAALPRDRPRSTSAGEIVILWGR